MPALATTTYFPDPDSLNTTGLVIAMLVYGWILLQSADYIGDAAEDMLEKCPSYGKIIGALLVPILGAIPDGMMILLSGMGSGPKSEIQDELNVGVGTLAGSTIMLLTIPFATAIYMNRRPVETNGRALIMQETKNQETRFTSEAENFDDFNGKTPWSRNLYKTTDNSGREMPLGATVEPGFAVSAWIMMGSTVTYLVVQIPAFFSSGPVVQDAAMISFVISLALLALYCVYSYSDDNNTLQYHSLKQDDKRDQLRRAIFEEGLREVTSLRRKGNSITEIFSKYANGKNFLTMPELKTALAGLHLGDASFDDVARDIDENDDQKVSEYEFEKFFIKHIQEKLSYGLSLETVEKDEKDSGQSIDKTALRDQLPDPEVLQTLEEWMWLKDPTTGARTLQRDAEQTVLCLEGLSKKQRFLVHSWCNRVEKNLRKSNKNMTFSHYSEPYMDPDDLTRAKRRLRLELQQLVDGKAPLDLNLRRWACASMQIRKFCLRKAANKEYHVFYKKCIEVLTEDKPSRSKNKGLDLDDVVKLSEYWKLPCWLTAQNDRKLAQKIIKDQYESTIKEYNSSQGRSSMSIDGFKYFLESMVVSDENASVAQKRKRFKHFGSSKKRRKQTMLLTKSLAIEEKDTKIAATEMSSLRASGPKTGYSSFNGTGDVENGGSGSSEDDAKEGDDEGAEKDDSISGAIFWMIWGSVLVAIFSDPMVAIISALSNRVGVNAFYVSFIVTPLVSNASEVVTAARMASKLTDITLTVALSTLYGAAIMNSTFCMAIFAGLVYFRGLEWNYSAEVIIIVITMYVMGALGILAKNGTFSVTHAAISLSLFPFSLIFVYLCQNVLGLS